MLNGQLTMSAQLVLCGIFAALALASSLLALLRKRLPATDLIELQRRTRSWWVMVSVFTAAIAFSKIISLIFFALLSFLALREYLVLIPVREADRPIIGVIYTTVPLQYLLIGVGSFEMFLMFVPLTGLLILSSAPILTDTPRGYVSSVGNMNLALLLTVFAPSHLGLLLLLPDDFNPIGGAAGLILYLVLLTELNDISQYIHGKLFRAHLLIPKVSPKKTAEGLAGGIATTMLTATLLAPCLTPLSAAEGMTMGLAIALSGFLGDTAMSALKRDIGVKDTGTLLPGHGGILDRIDSLILTAPLFFHYLHRFHFDGA